MFLYENGVEGDRVWLAGIEHRSSETNLGVVFFYFSSMSQIQADLGSFVAY